MEEVVGFVRKILALALFSIIFSLLTVQVKGQVTPVRVERVKDVCFIKVKGDHHTKSFIFHYDNLSPSSQSVYAEFKPEWGMQFSIWVTILEGSSMDVKLTGDYGILMDFRIEVNGVKVLEDAVVIPPPK